MMPCSVGTCFVPGYGRRAGHEANGCLRRRYPARHGRQGGRAVHLHQVRSRSRSNGRPHERSAVAVVGLVHPLKYMAIEDGTKVPVACARFRALHHLGRHPNSETKCCACLPLGSSEEINVLCRSHSWARTLCTFQRFIVCLGARTLSLVSNIICFALPSLLCSQQATVDLPRDSEGFDGRTCHTARAWPYEPAVISLFACDAFSVGRVFSISSCFGIPER